MTSFAQKTKSVRLRKAATIAAILEEESELKHSDVLEIGTGAGIISHDLAKRARSLTSVDVNDERTETEGYKYIRVESPQLPFDDDVFDIVLSNQVIEHIPEQDLHLAEALRVLRPNGVLYLATPNRLWPKEVHSQIYFLGWLPRFLASRLYQMKRNKNWDVYPLDYFSLLGKLKSHSCDCTDYGPIVIKNREHFKFTDSARVVKLLNALPIGVVRLLSWLMPSFIVLCTQRRTPRGPKIPDRVDRRGTR